MHYVIGDIHNEAKKLQSILNQIKIKPQDSLIVLGDIFDRGGTEADPVEVYFMLSGIQGELTWIRGNHDQWLADYVQKYYAQSERKRRKMVPYAYNTFEMMRKRLTQADMLHIAEQIQQLPLQKEMIIDGKSYLFAHAMTSHPAVIHKRGYYLMGNSSLDYYFLYGIDGYISFVGHTPASSVVWAKHKLVSLDKMPCSIWKNDKSNVYLMDCGSGFESGRLACMCIETGERFYSDEERK